MSSLFYDSQKCVNSDIHLQALSAKMSMQQHLSILGWYVFNCREKLFEAKKEAALLTEIEKIITNKLDLFKNNDKLDLFKNNDKLDLFKNNDKLDCPKYFDALIKEIKVLFLQVKIHQKRCHKLIYQNNVDQEQLLDNF